MSVASSTQAKKAAYVYRDELVEVASDRVAYTPETITSTFTYESTRVEQLPGGKLRATPTADTYVFQTERRVPKVGVMIVGWGGNNGSTVTAGIEANKHGISWETKEGTRTPDYLGSLTQSSTVKLGVDAASNEDVFVPMSRLVPLVHPNDLVIGGWDISSTNLGDAMKRAAVLDVDLQRQVYPALSKLVPLPSVYAKDFIAANQEDRADNLIPESTKQGQLDHLRGDIRDFKKRTGVDKVIVLWSANTERFSDVRDGLNDTADNILQSIAANESEVAPSQLFAIASILEGCTYINGAPQNTFVPGVIELAMRHNVFIGGDDFKTGQTKIKSVLVDFLVSSGIKPVSIVSYNHLGNNDGKNLSCHAQFRSKEISKSNVVDDMVASNGILYVGLTFATPCLCVCGMGGWGGRRGQGGQGWVCVCVLNTVARLCECRYDLESGEHPDHTVVIKYVPYVRDSKRALDEYTSEIFLGGHNTISMHNTCEDSLLAAPLIIDLVVLAELSERIRLKKISGSKPGSASASSDFERFHPVLSLLSFLLKAPLVPEGVPVVNALFPQRQAIVNVLRACVGLGPQNHMLLEQRMRRQAAPSGAVAASE